MQTAVEHELDRTEELQTLYQQHGWWADRELEDIRRAVQHTDEFIGVRDTDADKLVASARVLTDYVYFGRILDLIVHESYRDEGLGGLVMETIVELPALEDLELLTVNCRAGLVPFYEEFGFDRHDMTTELPDGTVEDYVLMVRWQEDAS